MNKDLGFLGSSTDSTKLSNTVSGLIVTFAGIIILIAKKFGVEIGTVEVSNFAQGVALAIGAIWTIYGLVVKLLLFLKDKKIEPTL